MSALVAKARLYSIETRAGSDMVRMDMYVEVRTKRQHKALNDLLKDFPSGLRMTLRAVEP